MNDVPDDLHEWVSFADSDGDTWLFDLTFLTSNHECIFGRGCPGVLTELAPEHELGCCSYGAHLIDDQDRRSVQERIALLDRSEWQFADKAQELGGAIHQTGDGEWVTRIIDDACIMANRPGFVHGAGCALHQAAERRGEDTIDWKPDACWQVPLRFDHTTDDNGHTTYVLREWKRHDWGEGGGDFAWWCTDDPLAFQAAQPVWKALRSEIVELCGSDAYARLADVITARQASAKQTSAGTAVFVPHPQVRRATKT